MKKEGISPIEAGLLLASLPFDSPVDVEDEIVRREAANKTNPHLAPNPLNKANQDVFQSQVAGKHDQSTMIPDVLRYDELTDDLGAFLVKALFDAHRYSNKIVHSLKTQDMYGSPRSKGAYLCVCDSRNIKNDINTRLETHSVKEWCSARGWVLPAQQEQSIKSLLHSQFAIDEEDLYRSAFALTAKITELKERQSKCEPVDGVLRTSLEQTIELLELYEAVTLGNSGALVTNPQNQQEKITRAQSLVEHQAKKMADRFKRPISLKDAVNAVAQSEHGLFKRNGVKWAMETILKETKKTW